MLVPPKRQFPTLLFWVKGSAIEDIWPLLVATAAVSSALTVAYSRYDLTWLELTTTPFTLVGLALSIFLGFRNNACYDRWWEARKLWGRLINTTRSYARQALTLVDGDEELAPVRRELVLRMVAYAHALRLHLRGQDRYADELAPFLPAEELKRLAPERNKPIALLQTLADQHRSLFDAGHVDVFHLPVLERTLTELTDIQGGCERIKNTPVPISYTELTHRIVALYVIFLPFGIINLVGDLAPVVVTFVAYCFLGLDAVGSQIENPFEEDPNDLPLGQISRMIENDLRQRLGDTDLRPDVQPVAGILL